MDNLLHRAAEDGDLERARRLIRVGLSVNCLDDKNRTPLHRAAERGRLEVAHYLSSFPECDLNAKDRSGLTPVWFAALEGRKDVAKLLLERGAEVDCTDAYNYTLLHWVSYYGWSDVARHILARGVSDPNAASATNKWTPLLQAAYRNHAEVASLLIRSGADVNQSDVEERTALHEASWEGHAGVVQVLLAQESLQLNLQEAAGGNTPLHYACLCGHPEVVGLLLGAGANPNIRNNVGKTALSRGMENWKLHIEEIRLLVDRGGFFERFDYEQICRDSFLKEKALKDVNLCSQSVINKYHFQSLPALAAIPSLAGMLPCVKKFKKLSLNAVESSIRQDIQANTFCNVVELRPIVLRMMCVESLLAFFQAKSVQFIKN